jgi:hypothetical protein
MRNIEWNAHVKVRIGNLRFAAMARVLDERNDVGLCGAVRDLMRVNTDGATACRSRSRPTIDRHQAKS